MDWRAKEERSMIRLILTLACVIAQAAPGEVRKLAGDRAFTEGPIADGKGNVYYSDIPNKRIMKWDGKALGVIEIPEVPANLCFDGATIYLTERKSLYAVEMNVREP
jgi:sugar lactone lactonase YvrE